MHLLNLFISNILNIGIFLNVILKMFKPKLSMRYICIISFLELLFLFIVNSLNISMLNAWVILITNFILLIFCFYGEVKIKLFIIATYVCCGSIYEIFAFDISHYLFKITYEAITIESIYYLMGNVFANLLLFCTMSFLSKYIITLSETKYPSRTLFLLSLPITSILFVASIKNFNDLLLFNNFVITLAFTGLLISNIFSFYVFFDVIKIINENNEIKLEKTYREIDKLNYQILEMKYKQSRSVIHDTKKHINIMKQLIDLKEYTELDNYINDLNSDISNNFNIAQTEQKVLNLIVNQKIQLLNKNKIKLKLDVDNSDLNFLSVYEQNLIFSNLLDNAIESCIREKNNKSKNIILKIRTEKNYIIIKMLNTCSNSKFRGVVPHTLKKNKEEHGFGLNIVTKIVHEHNGRISYDFDEKINTFKTKILFEVDNVKFCK